MSDPSQRRQWQPVSKDHPCPVCRHPDWCSVTADGTLAKCMRVEAGAWRSGTDSAGARYHLHRLDAAARGASAPPPRPPGPGTPRADADQLHRVYSALLAGLPLSERHRAALQARGLSDEESDRRAYRTLPVRGRSALARGLHERFGDALLTVPGFILKAGDGGRSYVTIAGAAGLLVPVRDVAGRVAALLSRGDDAGDGPRYSYLSSARHGGPGPGTPPHLPLGIAAPAATVRLTEGALKSDVAFVRSGLPTIGASGAGNWKPALDALRELGCQTVRLAFDADAWDKPAVARALADCSAALAAAGLAVELERWPAADGKGIDDLLATGKAPELLAGEPALAAIREALAAATAGEPPPPPDPLDRLDAVLSDGGAAALFTDRPLLDGLARLADSNPADYAARRAILKGRGVSLRELDAALRPFLRDLARERPPVLLAAAGYRVAAGRIVRRRDTPNGPVEEPLCNFTARITEVVTRDDGAEPVAFFTVAGALDDGRALPSVRVPASDFAALEWVTGAWHGEAVVFAGQGTRDHLRAAILLLSPDRARRTVYAHLGWREMGDGWHYLHAGGAIGPDGPAGGVEVSAPEPLAGFVLPDPPQSEGLVAAARASLALLGGPAPDRIAFPLLAAVYRAALGEAPGPIDFAVHLAGPHGAGKSELAALAQQHFGAGLDARHLPGGWASTANALEGLTFAAKDAILVVDDFAPRGASGDRQRLEREADRLLRAQGNRAGRQRMRADGSLRPDKPPRGLILSTGEDVPPGQSLRGRMIVLEVSPRDVALAGLTPHQCAAAAGLYAQTLAGFVRWLAPQYGELAARLPGERADLRERALTGAGSTRTPGIVADLALGLQVFLDFALAAGAITQAARGELAHRGWAALVEAGAAQAEHVQAAEPTALFLRLLAGAIGTTANVAGPDGREPPDRPEAWGWYLRTYGVGENERTDWYSHGTRIGWVEGSDLYLEPEASYAAAQELAHRQGDSLPVSPRTLHRRLHERGLLLSVEAHGGKTRYAVRRTLEGRRRDVLHIRADTLFPSASAPSAPTDPDPQQEQDLRGRTAPRECANGAPERPECAAASPSANGRSGGMAHLAHSDAGGGGGPRPVNPFQARAVGGSAARPAPDAPSPPPGALLYYQDENGRACNPAACVRWTWAGASRWHDAGEWLPPV
jgi:hypothetical protein